MTPQKLGGRFPSLLGALGFCAALLLTAFILAALSPAANRAAPLQITTIDTVGLTVSDMDRALAFYTGVLPFVKV